MKMARCNWFIVFLLFTPGISSFVAAQNELIFAPQDKGKAQAIVIPAPGSLRSDWWQYFNAPFSQQRLRLDAFIERLYDIIQNLPMEDQDEGQALSENIIANLQARIKLLEQQSLKSESPVKLKAVYTIEEWLELESRNRYRQQEFTDKQGEIENLNNAVDASTKLYNKELAAYISIDPTKKNKVLQGLHLMVSRSALELARLRLERNTKELNHLHISIEKLLAVINTAAKKLKATNDDLSALNNQRKEQLKALLLAETLLDNARSRVLGVMADTPVAVAVSRLEEQQVIYALLIESIAQLQLGITEGKISLVRLLIDKDIKSEALYQDLTNRQALIKDLSTQLVKWRTDSLREQARAQNMLLSQSTSDLKLQKIHEKRNKLTQETLLQLHRLKNLMSELNAINNLNKNYFVQQEGMVRHGWYRTTEIIKSTWDSGVSWLTTSLFNIGETPVTLLGLLRVVFILVIAWLLSYMFRRMLDKIAERSEDTGSALYTIGRLAHYLILLVGMMIALSSVGLDFTNLALVAGALSVGIGFGLQSIVNNFVSGLILLFERTLKVGDFIELDSGVQGIVMEINVRSTLINTNDNVDIIVPNAELVSAKVTNWTLRDATRRMRIPFGVAYGTDKELVKKAALEAAEKVSVTLQKPKKFEPQIWLVGFGDSSMDFELVVWVSQAAVKKPGGVTAAYLWEIESSLLKYDIEIPFPQRDLHLRSLFEKQGEEASQLLKEGSAIKKICL